MDGLDIFIIPSVNPDGATYSMYDFSGQRKNLTNHCASSPTGNNDPAARTLGRRHQPQLLGRHDLGGLHRRVDELHGDELHGPVPALRARDPQRGPHPDVAPEHQVRDERALVRRLLHVAPERLQAGRPRVAPVPALRHAELLRPDRRRGAEPDLQLPRHGDPAVADRPGQRRPVLRGRQPGRRGVLQERDHRLRLRDRRRQAPGRRLEHPGGLPAPVRRGADRRQRRTSPTRATTRRWSSPTATTRC